MDPIRTATRRREATRTQYFDARGRRGNRRSTRARRRLWGVRRYNPNTGRFLQTDPIPGGSANNYDYAAQDPINKFDLDGRMLPGGTVRFFV